MAEVCWCGGVVLRAENPGLSERTIWAAWQAINSPSTQAARPAAEAERIAELTALVASAERTLAALR